MLKKEWIRPDNGLYGDYEYLDWNTDDMTAYLDGNFTAQELLDIATHMKQYYKKEKK